MWDELRQHQAAGRSPLCAPYWHVRELFWDRNRALRDAQEHFGGGSGTWYERRFDVAFMAAIDWILDHSAEVLADLDEWMRSLPTA